VQGRKTLFESGRLMVAAVLASVVASVCCLGPFLLLATGLSGAWMSSVMAVEPLQPYLIALSLALVSAAGWQLLTRRTCEFDSGQARLSMPGKGQLALFVTTLGIVLVLGASEHWIPIVAG